MELQSTLTKDFVQIIVGIMLTLAAVLATVAIAPLVMHFSEERKVLKTKLRSGNTQWLSHYNELGLRIQSWLCLYGAIFFALFAILVLSSYATRP